MKREWHPDELVEHWTILPGERKLVGNKYGPTRLGFAVLLKFFQYEGRFPRQPHDIPLRVMEYVAQHVDVEPEAWGQYDWNGRSMEYHRAQIRQQLGFREASVADGEVLRMWLCDQVLSTTHRPEYLREAVYRRCRTLRIDPPTPERIDRIVNSAVHIFETDLCDRVLHRLSPTTRHQLDALLAATEPSEDDAQPASPLGLGHAVLHDLRADSGRATLDNLFREIAKLERVRALDLASDLFDEVSPKVLQTYWQRVAVEASYELRRHPEALRMTLMAVFGHCRSRNSLIPWLTS